MLVTAPRAVVLAFAVAVVLGDLIVGAFAFVLSVTSGFRPPPADPGIWPIAPQVAGLIYAAALVAATRFGGRAGFRRPSSDAWPWLWFVVVFLGPSLVAVGLAGVRPTVTWDYHVPQNAIAGIEEEVVYRGVILSLLMPLGMRRAALLSSALFAIPHLFDAALVFHITSIGATAVGFAAGLLLAAIRLRSGSIYPCIAAHVVYNVIAAIVRPQLIYPVAIVSVIWPAVVIVVALLALRGGERAVGSGIEIAQPKPAVAL